MSSPHELAAVFTTGVLDQRHQAGFQFPIGPTQVTVRFDSDLVQGLQLEDAGHDLRTMRCHVRVPGIRGTCRTELYLSAGFSDGDPHLLLYNRDGRKILDIDLRTAPSQADEPPIIVTPMVLDKDYEAVDHSVFHWLSSHGYEFTPDGFRLGDTSDPRRALINFLTLGLLKLHGRGHFVMPQLVQEVPPMVLAAPQEFYTSFREYRDQRYLEMNAENSGRCPPVQVPFTVEIGSKCVTMWASRFDSRTKSINACSGDFNSLAEVRDALQLRHGDRLRFQPLGPGHYRLERVEGDIYEPGIFVRLNPTQTRDGRTLDGFETMEIYRTDAVQRGYTWFATNGHHLGMSADRVRMYQEAISQGQIVPVYFMISVGGGGSNQIEFTARLLDLASSQTPTTCPEEPPDELPNSGRVWLKLTDLVKQQIDPADFVVYTTGNDLASAVLPGQFSFGYIRRKTVVPGPVPAVTEADVVDRLLVYLEESGFRFNREQVLNYWISLKTKPFVILAGLSGSGKSKLPKLVARALGAEFCQVAVSPGWTEDSDLLGYQNPLDQSGAFQLTPFTRFLLDASSDEQDRLWFVCLDEMNLARVEHYFAKFLSAIEGMDDLDRTINLHSGSDLAVPRSVTVPQAFFFTGTVNMDETTHTFSPKVLDRANLIEFEVTPDDLAEDLPTAADPGPSVGLSYSDFRRFCAAEGDSRFRSDLVEIARILYPVRAHFGYRVREEVERFIANGRNLMDPVDLFDLQIHQKILPKVRGSGTALETALRQLEDLARARGWRRSQAKVAEMLDRLVTDGITHFYR